MTHLRSFGEVGFYWVLLLLLVIKHSLFKCTIKQNSNLYDTGTHFYTNFLTKNLFTLIVKFGSANKTNVTLYWVLMIWNKWLQIFILSFGGALR